MIYEGDTYDERDTFKDLERVVRRTTKALRPHLDRFDAIAVTGVSGDSVGFPAALRLRKPIVSVRKQTAEGHHQWSGGDVAGYKGLPENARVLFLDDFIISGATHRRVEEAVKGLKNGAEIVGAYLYADGGPGNGTLNWWRGI